MPTSRSLLFAFAVLLAGCVENAPSPLAGNLLADHGPDQVSGVTHVDRLTDGLAPNEGDHWLTGITARLNSSRSSVVWDLGAPKPIRCVLVQGDNNDSYFLSGSQDGATFERLWEGEPAGAAGMRTRQAKIDATARYLRLTARGGDGLFSVGEVAAFSECPTDWPTVHLTRAEGQELNTSVQSKLWLFGAAAVLFLLLHHRTSPRNRWLFLAAPVLTGLAAISAVIEIYPFANTIEESMVRAIVAVIAGVLVVKEVFLPERYAPHPKVTLGTLGLLAVLALGCYYHFGSAQFFDAAKGRRTLVHTFDMRHYFPTAKYFKELRFDGLYLASLAAYLDNTNSTVESIPNSRLRDLTTYEMITAERAGPQLPAIRARFTPERWDEFKRDMKYLLDTMGRGDYLGSMQDHGGNATPVWLLPAWAIFRTTPANELTLSLAGMIDPVILLVFFVVLWRTFGLRVMLYTVILFGATDFYQFGSNLMGSTLRQDWLVALGLGACAIKSRRPFLGGFLLAYGGLIRAFPALAAMFLLVPILWWAIDQWRAHRKLPGVSQLWTAQRPAVRAVAGAAAAVVGLVLLSSALFGFTDSWVTWSKKIEMHAVGPSTNNVGLRNVLAWRPWHSAGALIRHEHPEPWVEWQRRQISNFAQLRPLFYLLNLAAIALVVLACRKRPLHQTALLGLLLIPYLFYPSNYYCHFIFLLPMAVAFEGAGARAIEGPAVRDRAFGWVVAVLCAMCVGQYATYSEGWTDLRYTYQSFVLLIGFAAIMIPLAREGWRDLRPKAATDAATAPPAAPPSPDPAATR